FDEPVDLPEARVDALVGARLFLGRGGVLFAALDSEQGAQIGFTQYDLFHRGILLSAVVSQAGSVTEVLPLSLDPTFASWSFHNSTRVSLGLSVPAGPRQSVQASLSERRGDARERSPVLFSESRAPVFFSGDGDLTYRRAEAKWVYDTSDDPLLPTRGMSLSAGVEAARFESEGLRPTAFPFFEPPLPPFRSEQVVVAVSGIRHFSVTPRQTVTLTARGSAGQSRIKNLFTGNRTGGRAERRDVSLDSLGGAIGVRHSVALRRHRERGNLSDLRFETGAEIGGERTAPDLGPSPLKRLSLSLGVVFRNQWGRVRATFTYLDLGEAAR
ncbi:MAG TPA: BamA/TamA family outer membrane protein, partial [Thermoanaerobaculia bacterium]|nr:BamA/TamA family outer membrane protein [Thermoanaerobaculia bacterium]